MARIWGGSIDRRPRNWNSQPIAVMGLTDGTDNSFVFPASSRVGAGTASDPSGTITPKSPQTIKPGDPGGAPFGPAVTQIASASSRYALAFATTTSPICMVDPSGVVNVASPAPAPQRPTSRVTRRSGQRHKCQSAFRCRPSCN